MRFKIFLPRQIVFFVSEKITKFYEIKYKFDGDLYIKEKESLNSSNFILIIDSSIPFRRNFQFSIKQKIIKEFVLASAAGLFPFSLDEYECCLGAKGEDSYIFALKNVDYEKIVSVIGLPMATLISDADEYKITNALKMWMSNKNVYAINSSVFPLDIEKLLSAALSLFLVGLITSSWISWNYYFNKNNEVVMEQSKQLRDKAEPLFRKRMVIAHMQAFHKAMDKLNESTPDGTLAMMLSSINSLPDNCYIEKIEFEDDKVVISGWGTVPTTWFSTYSIPESNYQINDLPKLDQFTFWFEKK